MTPTNTYATGDFIRVRVTLMRNGAPETGTISAVSMAIVLRDRSAVAAGTAVVAGTQISTAVWQAGWPPAQTLGLLPGRYLIEVQATVDGETVTYAEQSPEIEIVAGLI